MESMPLTQRAKIMNSMRFDFTGNTLAGTQCLRLADEDGDAEGEYSHGDCRVGCTRAEGFVCPLRYARRFRASAMPFSFRH